MGAPCRQLFRIQPPGGRSRRGRDARRARPALRSSAMATARTIELKTPVPGPRTREVLDRLAASVASPLALTFPVVVSEARGATITDVDGNTFIDFAGGVGCLNVGHSHPHV